VKGELLEQDDPGRGSGMEQARELVCGENRREAEKTWGRNVAGPWNASHQVDARGWCREEGRNLGRWCSSPKALSVVSKRRDSEEESDREG